MMRLARTWRNSIPRNSPRPGSRSKVDSSNKDACGPGWAASSPRIWDSDMSSSVVEHLFVLLEAIGDRSVGPLPRECTDLRLLICFMQFHVMQALDAMASELALRQHGAFSRRQLLDRGGETRTM